MLLRKLVVNQQRLGQADQVGAVIHLHFVGQACVGGNVGVAVKQVQSHRQSEQLNVFLHVNKLPFYVMALHERKSERLWFRS